MATWSDVERLCARLPDARPGEAHDGSPAWYAGRHAFARLRHDDAGAELAQVWSRDLDLPAMLADRSRDFPVLQVFRFRVSPWVALRRVGRRELAELLLDSYTVRGGVRRGDAVDLERYLRGT